MKLFFCVRLIIFSLICLAFLFNSIPFAESASKEESFIGVITGNRVNLRAGSDKSSEVICRLNEGDEIKVIGQSNKWYKIELPKRALVYIHKTNVERKNDTGIAKEDKSNVRTAATPSSAVIGQLNKGTAVKILREYLDWYEIEAPPNTFGWVHSDYVRKKGETAHRREDSLKNKIAQLDEAYEMKLKGISSPRPGETPIAVGIVEDVGKIYGRISQFKLVKAGEVVGYLTSKKVDLNKYVNLEVNIWGVKKQARSGMLLIEVDAVQIIQ